VYAAAVAILSEAYRSYGIDFWTAVEIAQRGGDVSQPMQQQQQQELTPVDNDQSLAMLEGMMSSVPGFRKGR
jgi:hypothetical protein